MSSKSSFTKSTSRSVTAGPEKVKELKEMLEHPAHHAPLDEELKTLKAKLKEAEETLASEKDKYLRALAEMENSRKRMEREKEDLIRYGNEKLLKEFLTVYDHLEMALTHAVETAESRGDGKPTEEDPFIQGVTLVLREFIGIMEKFGVQVISGEGAPFDPHKQESMALVESADHAAGNVVHVHRKGFSLHGRLIRPALVTVAKAPGSQTPPGESTEEKEEEEEKTVH